MKKIILLFVLAIIILGWLYFLPKEDPSPDLMTAEELSVLASAQREFAFNLFAAIAESDKNAFVSPYSIHTALMLAHLGAGGETKEEMEALLNIEDEDMRELALGLKRYLENISETTEVSIANAFFLRNDIPFLESYKESGRKYFESEIAELPDTGGPINKWVKEKTKNKIEEVIDSGPIDQNIIAYLVNAIHFRGIWDIEFDKAKTSPGIFYGTEEVEVEMMEDESEYYHYYGNDFQAVTLKYKDGKYLFHAIMPGEDHSLSDLYNKEKISEIMGSMRKGEVLVIIPKFTMEDSLELKSVLESLGMVSAFDEIDADFSKMVDITSPGVNVFISQVFHKSFIEIDEKGTEAAAVTAVEMELLSVPTMIEFNRPFFFVIEEADTETILFMGQLVNP